MLFGKYINQYYRKYWYLFFAVILCDAIVDIVQLLIPLIIGNIISAFSTDFSSVTTINTNPLRVLTGFTNIFTVHATDTLPFYQTDFFVAVMSLLVIGTIIFIGRIGWRFFSAHIGAKVERDLREEMFAHIQKLSLSYYSQKKVGGLLSFFTYDLQTIKSCFTEGLIFTTDLVVLGSLSLVMMGLISGWITLFASIPLVLFVVLGGIVGKEEAKRYKISSDAFEDLSDFTEENLQGFSVVKAFLKEKSRIHSFRRLAQDTEEKSVQYLKWGSFIDMAINVIIAIAFFILFLFGSLSILNPSYFFAGKLTDVGKLTSFVGYFDSLIWPMIAGGMLIDFISRASGARKRIAEILDAKPDIADETNPSHAALQGKVEFRHLSFTYPDGTAPALRDLSFVVEPGMMVGVVGRTGCGKSTLVSLLPKLYNLEKGMLFVDDTDIMDWRKEELRSQVGIVLQEGFLFSGSIKENIAFSEPLPGVYDEEKIRRSARFANVEEDILSFPHQYDTTVGEKGATLSGGQRQRVSIARAIYKEPSLLILDDSLSAVDADTEKEILYHIHHQEKKLTTFVIAHRISAIEQADLILVLDEGKLIGQGTHDQLYANCPFYHDLCELQKLEKEVQ